MKTVGVVTSSRADFGIYRPVLRRIEASDRLELRVYVTGMHLSPEFGLTVDEIEAEGFEVAERVEMLLASDTPAAIGASMALGTVGFAQLFARSRPDLLLVLGDRFEMHAAALAALPFTLPVAHLHGGEVTAGAIDEALRHSITKLSHLHFVATAAYGRRVIQLGEEPWRVTVSGAPALDNLASTELWSAEELAAALGLDLSDPPVVVTFHPTTLEWERADEQVEALLGALEDARQPVVFTMPNADTGGRRIRRRIQDWISRTPRSWGFESLGTERYFSLLAVARAMVGNSSSGLLEAPSFAVPVVNVGQRQAGRLRPPNVIDVGTSREEIAAGLERALEPSFRAGLEGMVNPYGDGHGAARIVERLEDVALDERLVIKRFHDIEGGG